MRVADRPLNSLDERPATESQAAAEKPGIIGWNEISAQQHCLQSSQCPEHGAVGSWHAGYHRPEDR
jgi:hypothetical protein